MNPRTNIFSEDPEVIREEIEKMNESILFINYINNLRFKVFQFKILNKIVGIIVN